MPPFAQEKLRLYFHRPAPGARTTTPTQHRRPVSHQAFTADREPNARALSCPLSGIARSRKNQKIELSKSKGFWWGVLVHACQDAETAVPARSDGQWTCEGPIESQPDVPARVMGEFLPGLVIPRMQRSGPIRHTGKLDTR